MKIRFTIFVFCLFASLGMFSQTQKAFIEAGDKSYVLKDYYSSLYYFNEALAFDSTDIKLNYKTAEAARLFQSYKKAAKHYSVVLEKDTEGLFPLTSYHLASMQQMQGQYDAAATSFKMYVSEHGDEDPYLTQKAQKELASVDWAKQMLLKADPGIRIEKLGDQINTPFTEFGAIQGDSGIVYSSMRFEPLVKANIPVPYISKVLNENGTEFKSGINRTDLHAAHVTYNMNKSRVYYTICKNLNANDIRCELYSRAVLGDGSLGNEVKLPDHINLAEKTSTQPNIGFDKGLGKEILYFVSDREGGLGKLDIWYSIIEGQDSYSQALNLGIVNSPEDDITPFFHDNSQVLFYSTNGNTSFGGFDIYSSVKGNGVFEKPVNLGSPQNSSYNDLYYVLSPDGIESLFSSNRLGSNYIDELNESCCYDIYKSVITDKTIKLIAYTFDSQSLDSLEGVTITVIDNSSKKEIAQVTNSIANDFSFDLEKGKTYTVISSKPGYHNDTMSINTMTSTGKNDILRKIYLQRSNLELQVFVFDAISRESLPGVSVRLKDLTDGSIQEVLLTNEIANDFSFTLVPGHTYRLIGTKERFYDAVLDFIGNEDGNGLITKELYLPRRDLNIYLPLMVYFDNDIPEAYRDVLKTNMTYSQAFDLFVLKQYDFVDSYSAGLKDEERTLAIQRVKDFFLSDVNGGYDRLHRFFSVMVESLSQGKSFEISLKGYASPRADTKYNLALSQRRVSSMQNEIRAYKKGIFLPYIDNGQLKITELAFGESLAPDNVSDALYDQRNSIFSPEASRERRVEIVEIKTKGDINN